ncbi:M10 family metallopeptidase C-terminal domain-containing protein [Pseudomonas sp.]|uniref:M10 family metallopeptidase C-terminal domain-containing protein n=1 Tax=Pseudomonas sp. TaxID=306 RepID=UPI0032663F84
MRPIQQQYISPNRRSDPATGIYHTNGNNPDATLRANDPHVTKISKQSFDKQRAVEQLTQGTSNWQDWNRNGKTEISYHFKNEWGASFSEPQRQEARRSIQSWSDVANLTFTENGRQAEGRLSFRISNKEVAAEGFYPSFHAEAGDTIYNPNFVSRPVITHEIGHTLGLTHPGQYNGKTTEGQRVYAEDSKAHSVMSYFDAQGSGKQLGELPNAPMMDDISAAQKLYGANHQIRRDNTTYGFNSNSERDYYSLKNHRDNAAFCVWDGAGNDTLDFSGYGNNQVINLKAGSFSDVGGYQGNVSIAHDCSIENAIGGSGNDVLIGNEAGNRLTGGLGGDRMRGGGGPDVFVYNHAGESTPENPDEIMDFISGTDRIDVSGALRKAGLASLSFVNAWSGKAGETRLTYDEKSDIGVVSIDLTGDGQANFLIQTHGRVKPEDIVPFQTTKITPRISPVRPQFVFNNASESSFANARLFTDFTTGTDKLDLRGLEKQANTRLTLVNAFTGRVGEAIVSYNPHTYRYFVAIDLTGNRRPDFLVKSTQVIKPKDILVN